MDLYLLLYLIYNMSVLCIFSKHKYLQAYLGEFIALHTLIH